jgi:hypothetical protein
MPMRLWNSVRTIPGQTAWIRTPVPSSSFCRSWENALIYALVVAYVVRFGRCGEESDALRASRDETLMIAPRPRATIPGRAARVSLVIATT